MKISEKDIGRRVMVNGEYDCQVFNNEPGVLKCLNHVLNEPGIEFDKLRSAFHTLDNCCKQGHGFYVPESMITFIEEENKMDMDFQVGDEVECLLNGDGVVKNTFGDNYPIYVKFKDGSLEYYTKEGKYFERSPNKVLFHKGSIKHEGSKIIIDPVKSERGQWVNVYLDSDGNPFFGALRGSKEEADTRRSEGEDFNYITTIQLKRKKP